MGKKKWLALALVFSITSALSAQEPIDNGGVQPASPPVSGSSPDTCFPAQEKNPAGDDPAKGDDPGKVDDPANVDDPGKGEGGIYLATNSEDIRILLQQLSHMEKINIVATGDVQGSVSINLYGASLDEALEAILVPNGFSYVRRNNFIYVMKADKIDTFSTKPREREIKIYKLSYLNIVDAREILTLYLSKEGEIKSSKESANGAATGEAEMGGETNSADNTVVIKDYVEVHANIAKALKELDQRPKQVLVEATLIEVSLDDNNRLGVDFSALGGVDFSQLGAKSNLLNVTDIEADGATIDSGFNHVGTRGFTDSGNAEGFSFGILKSNVAFFIDALEKVTDTNVLANPKVMALNRQKAEIIIGGRLGYFGSETLSEGGFSQQEVEFLDTGTQLRFRPYIGEDEYIRLELHPQRSDGIVDSITGLPSETTSEVTTNVMVKDGDTVIIGGLIETRDTVTISQVPFFGTLPGIGWLFRKEATGTKRVEIVILITPHIVDPGVTDDDAEMLRTGYEMRKESFRSGFKVYTRTVRAQRHIDEARRALDAGKVGFAAFHLGWAEVIDPHNSDIYELKAQLNQLRKRTEPRNVQLEEYLWNQTD
jgi:type IV pilus assembly protein PilQ